MTDQQDKRAAAAKDDADYFAEFKAKCTVTDTDCWIWNGWRCHRKGAKSADEKYAVGNYKGKNVRLNRWMLGYTQRPLVKGELALHKCNNAPCINPEHLYIGTHQQNMDDMNMAGRNGYSKRTHCSNGHPFNDENTYVVKTSRGSGRGRACKVCWLAKNRIKLGWPVDLAYSTPPLAPGVRIFKRHKNENRT